ncbi:class II aldolase/adducin family protein [Hoeflea poritis]|uniref:Class II aldolase/adducin family protein n=1 Tax=Hoeflea poritis TaxID=2993659 RepID=A0ABT4VVC7_9HYPH|nr:class II aldolase/adducin family protein [Hoeflea poritis]MDA4848660.1 class II aldolase/adducin family protein [Hoeflea poritis]
MISETDIRQRIIDACREMNRNGLNQGTSGNISVRFEDGLLITPTAIPYDEMSPDMISKIYLSGDMTGNWEGPKEPSSEWRFHWQILKHRPEFNAVVHAHAPYCTTLAILRKPIPACHYMVAVFGGNDVRCSGYSTFGTKELADMALTAMEDRSACLLANHGMIAAGDSLKQAMWRAVELETLARQYCQSLQLGEPVILSEDDIRKTLERMDDYGV